MEHDPCWNWHEALSPGEVQRLGFLRLYFHRPQLAFLDEMTSALSMDLEEKVMSLCKDMNITIVSIGHRDSLKRYHDKVLTMGLPDGGWRLEEAR